MSGSPLYHTGWLRAAAGALVWCRSRPAASRARATSLARRAARVHVLALAAALLACASPAREGAAGVDDFGDSLPAIERPERIVSLSPATTELLFALGVGDRVVGRTRWDLYPPEASAVPDLGNGIRPNVEVILATRADLVLLYATADNRDAANALRAAGVPVVALRTDRIADFERLTTVVGDLVGEPDRARVVIDSVRASLARVRAATDTLPHPSVFLVAYQQPLMTIGAGSFLSELVAIAGGRNVFEDLPAPSPQVTFEEVLRRDPDVVLAGPLSAAEIRASSRWQTLPAVREGRVLVLDTALTIRPGVRLGEAARSIAELLHPGAVR
ncbi:MAG TPA: helical backbone metal receptor [Gemmatimonadaceae bacterium]